MFSSAECARRYKLQSAAANCRILASELAASHAERSALLYRISHDIQDLLNEPTNGHTLDDDHPHGEPVAPRPVNNLDHWPMVATPECDDDRYGCTFEAFEPSPVDLEDFGLMLEHRDAHRARYVAHADRARPLQSPG